MSKKKETKQKKWGSGNYFFLKVGTIVSTTDHPTLEMYYKFKKNGDDEFVITGYTEKLFIDVFDKCYGIFVNIYQNFSIDEHMTYMRENMLDENVKIARIISKSCFSIGVIELSNFFNQRDDQVYSLKTLELILLNHYPNAQLPPLRNGNTCISEVVRNLRDKFYAHRDFNVEAESDKMQIWDFVKKLEEYYGGIVSQINRSPKNYKRYIEIGCDNMRSFFNRSGDAS